MKVFFQAVYTFVQVNRFLGEELASGIDEAIRAIRQTAASPTRLIFEDFDNGSSYNLGLLYAYIRSFVLVARHRDTQVVAEIIGVSRPAVSTQITKLEGLLGCRLFTNLGVRSKITARGIMWLPRAEEFLRYGSVFQSKEGTPIQYHCVQIPLREIERKDAPVLLQRFCKAWKAATSDISDPMFQPFREHWILYRQRLVDDEWEAMKIGSRSPYALRFGSDAARTNIGKPLHQMTGGADVLDELRLVLDGVNFGGGVHYSEVICNIFDPQKGVRQPVVYRRVVAELSDGERPVFGSVIELRA